MAIMSRIHNCYAIESGFSAVQMQKHFFYSSAVFKTQLFTMLKVRTRCILSAVSRWSTLDLHSSAYQMPCETSTDHQEFSKLHHYSPYIVY